MAFAVQMLSLTPLMHCTHRFRIVSQIWPLGLVAQSAFATHSGRGASTRTSPALRQSTSSRWSAQYTALSSPLHALSAAEASHMPTSDRASIGSSLAQNAWTQPTYAPPRLTAATGCDPELPEGIRMM